MKGYSSLVYLIATCMLTPLVLFVGDVPDAHPSVAFLVRAWTMPFLVDGGIMSCLGLVWAGGMYYIARAHSVALASVVAPFEYVALPINALGGFIIWQEIPALMTWAGTGLILVSGLYIVYREQQERSVQVA